MLHQTTATAVTDSVIELQPASSRRRLLWRIATYRGAIGRFLVIAAIAFWLGGFSFYSGVAIPMGVEVLGTHKAVGFITQRVTNWLNVCGVVALTILLANTLAMWKGRGKLLRYTLLATWAAMAMIEIELIALHPVMDRLLTAQPVREILNPDRFDLLHHVYLISTTVQWLFGMIHVWCVAVAWQHTARTPTPAAHCSV